MTARPPARGVGIDLDIPGAWDQIWGWSMTGVPLGFWDFTFLYADDNYRRVAETWLHDAGREITVSTVFAMSDVSRHGVFPPLFETMIFVDGDFLRGEGLDAIFGYRRRVRTIEEAFAQHDRHVLTLAAAGARLALPGGGS